MSVCEKCGHLKRTGDGLNFFTPDQFKNTFKVGDTLTGHSTGMAMKLTAIGECRFLYTDSRDKECVATIMAQFGWKLISRGEKNEIN